jgi:hypothetical protein
VGRRLLATVLGTLLLAGCGGSRAESRRQPPGPRLFSVTPAVISACRRMQAGVRFTIYCPQRLPRATRGWPPGHQPAKLHVEVYGKPHHWSYAQPYGLDFSYSAPVEPAPGSWWRRHLWLNQPRFFLHFNVFRVGGIDLPPRSQLQRAVLGGRRGWLKRAAGYGLSGQSFWWPNHTWFFWRSHGVLYAASLHYFGRGTLRLLDKLVANLRPT